MYKHVLFTPWPRIASSAAMQGAYVCIHGVVRVHTLGDHDLVQLPEQVLLPVAAQHSLNGRSLLELAWLDEEHSPGNTQLVRCVFLTHYCSSAEVRSSTDNMLIVYWYYIHGYAYIQSVHVSYHGPNIHLSYNTCTYEYTCKHAVWVYSPSTSHAYANIAHTPVDTCIY